MKLRIFLDSIIQLYHVEFLSVDFLTAFHTYGSKGLSTVKVLEDELEPPKSSTDAPAPTATTPTTPQNHHVL